ncbi:MAG TPA: Mth938-like domain-containing protein [Casimicrobiaceae bacterium]|nr:Mth938-like domain-containing protein [Casimicrobiaceae bacterium]
MKFHLSRTEGNTVTGTGPGWVRVNADEYRASFVLSPERVISTWASSFESLTESDFEAILALAPEIALVGTGAKQRFPHPRLYRALTDSRIGVEIMDTSAAARTFNIVAAEGRRVVAGLILP